MTYRILVTGSRLWFAEEVIWEALDSIRLERGPGMVVVHGACPRGADEIADRWARFRFGVEAEPYPAMWGLLGKRAGFVRNQEMVDQGAMECLAFILDGSAGASHCMAAAKAAGIPTRVWLQSSDPVLFDVGGGG